MIQRLENIFMNPDKRSSINGAEHEDEHTTNIEAHIYASSEEDGRRK